MNPRELVMGDLGASLLVYYLAEPGAERVHALAGLRPVSQGLTIDSTYHRQPPRSRGAGAAGQRVDWLKPDGEPAGARK